MMNCKRAARLMSDELDRDLSGGERFGIRLHLLLCAGCRPYRRQMAFLRQACGRLVPGRDGAGRPPASPPRSAHSGN